MHYITYKNKKNSMQEKYLQKKCLILEKYLLASKKVMLVINLKIKM